MPTCRRMRNHVASSDYSCCGHFNQASGRHRFIQTSLRTWLCMTSYLFIERETCRSYDVYCIPTHGKALKESSALIALFVTYSLVHVSDLTGHAVNLIIFYNLPSSTYEEILFPLMTLECTPVGACVFVKYSKSIDLCLRQNRTAHWTRSMRKFCQK